MTLKFVNVTNAVNRTAQHADVGLVKPSTLYESNIYVVDQWQIKHNSPWYMWTLSLKLHARNVHQCKLNQLIAHRANVVIGDGCYMNATRMIPSLALVAANPINYSAATALSCWWLRCFAGVAYVLIYAGSGSSTSTLRWRFSNSSRGVVGKDGGTYVSCLLSVLVACWNNVNVIETRTFSTRRLVGMFAGVLTQLSKVYCPLFGVTGNANRHSCRHDVVAIWLGRAGASSGWEQPYYTWFRGAVDREYG